MLGRVVENMSQKMQNEILYRMMGSSSQTDFISLSYKSTLSQMIDLIIAIRMIKRSSKSNKISEGFDQFKVWKSLGAPVRSGRWNAGEASKFQEPIFQSMAQVTAGLVLVWNGWKWGKN